jgi:hypothetical protein
LLVDAGFNTYEVLETTLEKEISVLCPEQAEHTREGGPQRIPLREFRYEEDGNYYVCPAGERLNPWRGYAGNPATGQRAYVQYATQACRDCERRVRCTRGEIRTIQRAVGQELKEALRTVMAQPQAKQIFAKRKAMVEPVFSHLRERQGLNRFRRRGLAGARLEFRLHLMAYNLSRALAYARRGAKGSFLCLWRALGALTGALERHARRGGLENAVTRHAPWRAAATAYG